MRIESIHKRMTINSFSNGLRYFAYFVVTFLLTPFIIRTIGDSMYGVWVIISSLIGYAGILEMGMQTAIVKLVAEYDATGDNEKFNGIVTTALTFFLFVGIIVALICWFIAPHFIEYLIKDKSSIIWVKRLMYVLGFDIGLTFLGYVFSGMVFGMQIYHIKNILDICILGIYTGLVYTFLGVGGILALAVIKTTTDLITLISSYILCKKVYSALRMDYRAANRESFKELVKFGSKIFASSTMAKAANNADPLIITYYMSTIWTAIFSIPKRLIDYIKEITWSMSLGFMPMFSELQGKNDIESIRSIYMRYTRYILILTLPILTAMIIFGAEFIELWIGKEYALKGKYLLYLLVISFIIESIQPLLWRLFIGVDRLNFLVKMSTISSLTYIGLSILLVKYFGINGIGLSLLTISLLKQIISIEYACRYLGIGVLRFLSECHLMPMLSALIFGVSIFYIEAIFRANSYFSMVMSIGCCLPVYFLLTYILALKQNERQIIHNTLNNYLLLRKGRIEKAER
jgi:O-antigen/teichoic acid export membrane protein